MRLDIHLPKNFNFEAATRDHGWYLLPPFYVGKDEKTVMRAEKLESGKLLMLEFENNMDQLHIKIKDDRKLTDKEVTEVIKRVEWMYRINEDLTGFYELCSRNEGWSNVVKLQKGRLLRSSSLFEDIIKTILTTNTTWSRTVSMTENLVKHLGEKYSNDSELYAFPTPEAILEKGEEFLNTTVKLGYRSKYIYDFAENYANGIYDFKEWQNPNIPTEKVASEITKINGVGPYALSIILMIVGRYDFLPIDSEFKKHVKTKYYPDITPSKAQMEKIYEEWEEYKFLAYWFDV